MSIINSTLMLLLLQFIATGGIEAPKPLYRDPIHDGAADPEIIRNRDTGEWYMFYTNRRADSDDPGVAWAHGTPIGIAVSKNLSDWKYLQEASIEYHPDEGPSYWAPSLVDDGNKYHMFLTYVPGTFSEWQNHPRHIVHLTSDDLLNWHFEKVLDLMSDNVIDADVLQMPDGSWRMWYNQEPGGKLIALADSPDLYNWNDHGLVPGIGKCEAPKAFRWKGSWWLICDEWKGLAVYRSDDAQHWTRQEGNILGTPGHGKDDEVMGGHCEVLVIKDRAFIFYFTHPDRKPDADPSTANLKRSSIQVAELLCKDGLHLSCERDDKVHFPKSAGRKKTIKAR